MLPQRREDLRLGRQGEVRGAMLRRRKTSGDVERAVEGTEKGTALEAPHKLRRATVPSLIHRQGQTQRRLPLRRGSISKRTLPWRPERLLAAG